VSWRPGAPSAGSTRPPARSSRHRRTDGRVHHARLVKSTAAAVESTREAPVRRANRRLQEQGIATDRACRAERSADNSVPAFAGGRQEGDRVGCLFNQLHKRCKKSHHGPPRSRGSSLNRKNPCCQRLGIACAGSPQAVPEVRKSNYDRLVRSCVRLTGRGQTCLRAPSTSGVEERGVVAGCRSLPEAARRRCRPCVGMKRYKAMNR
jgi:hypothetical protein